MWKKTRTNLLYAAMAGCSLATTWFMVPRALIEDARDAASAWIGAAIQVDRTLDDRELDALLGPPPSVERLDSDFFARYESIAFAPSVAEPVRSVVSPTALPSLFAPEAAAREIAAGRFHDGAPLRSTTRAGGPSATAGSRTFLSDRLQRSFNARHTTSAFRSSSVRPDWLRSFSRSIDQRNRSRNNTTRAIPGRDGRLYQSTR